MKITYSQAMLELEAIKQEWIKLEVEIEQSYNNPKESIHYAGRIIALNKHENQISAAIKESSVRGEILPFETDELRRKYNECQQEYKKAQARAIEIEKTLLGMATPAQKEQIKAMSMLVMEPVQVPHRLRLIIETTPKASPKTFKILKESMVAAWRGSRECKAGEYTVSVEEE